ncbi:hypothetical protein AVEN_259674-1 [Araneus ventricosus]|uniref:Uncharacterized protein n=1 Tax=Araneus ventricosus TaxID=182803 RepID=A0A4Y2CU82_ARAVE|nr:hypothetical protein AVEN_259674-1 [Araneus ventricosus]
MFLRESQQKIQQERRAVTHGKSMAVETNPFGKDLDCQNSNRSINQIQSNRPIKSKITYHPVKESRFTCTETGKPMPRPDAAELVRKMTDQIPLSSSMNNIYSTNILNMEILQHATILADLKAVIDFELFPTAYEQAISSKRIAAMSMDSPPGDYRVTPPSRHLDKLPNA